MTGNRFEVTFRFHGRLADRGDLDGSDYATSTTAVRRLLALHAYCFLNGKVPRASYSDGDGYRVLHVASRAGSHVDIWAVALDPRVQGVAAYFAGVYSSEIKVGINACARFLRDSLKAALGRGSPGLPEFPRAEPVLEGLSDNRAPLVDAIAEQDVERTRLREATVRILGDVARPNGRSADWLEIEVDGEKVAVIDVETLRHLLNERQYYAERQAQMEHEITAALTPIRRPRKSRSELS